VTFVMTVMMVPLPRSDSRGPGRATSCRGRLCTRRGGRLGRGPRRSRAAAAGRPAGAGGGAGGFGCRRGQRAGAAGTRQQQKWTNFGDCHPAAALGLHQWAVPLHMPVDCWTPPAAVKGPEQAEAACLHSIPPLVQGVLSWAQELQGLNRHAGAACLPCLLTLFHGVPPSLQELQGLNRHAEAAMRRVEAAGGDPAAYAPAVEAALGAYESASQQVPPAPAAAACPTLMSATVWATHTA
jgi:hypothetical protein